MLINATSYTTDKFVSSCDLREMWRAQMWCPGISKSDRIFWYKYILDRIQFAFTKLLLRYTLTPPYEQRATWPVSTHTSSSPVPTCLWITVPGKNIYHLLISSILHICDTKWFQILMQNVIWRWNTKQWYNDQFIYWTKKGICNPCITRVKK